MLHCVPSLILNDILFNLIPQILHYFNLYYFVSFYIVLLYFFLHYFILFCLVLPYLIVFYLISFCLVGMSWGDATVFVLQKQTESRKWRHGELVEGDSDDVGNVL
jgi:hypothetical protein